MDKRESAKKRKERAEFSERQAFNNESLDDSFFGREKKIKRREKR